MKGQGMLISAFAFALVIAVFAVINVDPVQVNFLFAKTSTPLILVILVSTLLGGLTVGLFGMIRIYKLQKSLKAADKKLSDLQAGPAGETVHRTSPAEAAAAGRPSEDGGAEDREAASAGTDETDGKPGESGRPNRPSAQDE